MGSWRDFTISPLPTYGEIYATFFKIPLRMVSVVSAILTATKNINDKRGPQLPARHGSRQTFCYLKKQKGLRTLY